MNTFWSAAYCMASRYGPYRVSIQDRNVSSEDSLVQTSAGPTT